MRLSASLILNSKKDPLGSYFIKIEHMHSQNIDFNIALIKKDHPKKY